MAAMLRVMGAGKHVWATVLRRGGIRLVRGQDVRDESELLSWTYEGATCWQTIGEVTWQRMGDADAYLAGD